MCLICRYFFPLRKESVKPRAHPWSLQSIHSNLGIGSGYGVGVRKNSSCDMKVLSRFSRPWKLLSKQEEESGHYQSKMSKDAKKQTIRKLSDSLNANNKKESETSSKSIIDTKVIRRFVWGKKEKPQKLPWYTFNTHLGGQDTGMRPFGRPGHGNMLLCGGLMKKGG